MESRVTLLTTTQTMEVGHELELSMHNDCIHRSCQVVTCMGQSSWAWIFGKVRCQPGDF